MAREHTSLRPRTHRYRGLFRLRDEFARHQFSADYTISMLGFDFRHGHRRRGPCKRVRQYWNRCGGAVCAPRANSPSKFAASTAPLATRNSAPAEARARSDRCVDLNVLRASATQLWPPFLHTYRTMCLAPQPHFRRVLEDVRAVQLAVLERTTLTGMFSNPSSATASRRASFRSLGFTVDVISGK
jgi:hypothetical protein